MTTMDSWFDPRPEIGVLESEFFRLLGYPSTHQPQGRALELAAWARAWYSENGRPWVHASEFHPYEFTERGLRVAGYEFTSVRLREMLLAAEAHAVVLVAVSAGPECEEKARQLWKEEKPDEYFFLEMFGSAVVEHLITTTGARLCAWSEQRAMTVLPHYSPGYSGWDVADQTKLFQLIQRGFHRDVASRIQVLDTGMLKPKKSLLAVFGVTRHIDRVRSLAGLIPCENCSFPGCPYRKAPYRNSLPQIEDVRRLQSSRAKEEPERASSSSALTRGAKYSTSAKALRKWSQERLRLRIGTDGAVEALFRYEGTTCTNLGRPLEYDYRVGLSSAEQGYRIIEASCAPALGDTGHLLMCEYISNAAGLVRAMESERPLLGKPLDEVLRWTRSYSPAGCYCDAASRAHKWGLVFEVIHFALVNQAVRFNPE